jgi:hypothetical protein
MGFILPPSLSKEIWGLYCLPHLRCVSAATGLYRWPAHMLILWLLPNFCFLSCYVCPACSAAGLYWTHSDIISFSAYLQHFKAHLVGIEFLFWGADITLGSLVSIDYNPAVCLPLILAERKLKMIICLDIHDFLWYHSIYLIYLALSQAQYSHFKRSVCGALISWLVLQLWRAREVWPFKDGELYNIAEKCTIENGYIWHCAV